MRGWTLVLGAMLGMAVGVVSLGPPVTALLMRDLEAEFQWSRTQISMGTTILGITLALMSPLVGWLADRIAEVWIVAFSMTSLLIALLLLSRMEGDIRVYYALFVALGTFGSGSATLVYARIINAAFDKGRGRALGLALIGNGLTAILLPLVLAPYSHTHGWRQAYVALAALVAITLPILVSLLYRRGSIADRASVQSDARAQGLTLADAMKERVFWLIAGASTLTTLSVSGMLVHFVAFLADEGVSGSRAGVYASLLGVSLIVGRLVTGWLIDRFFAPSVAVAMTILSAAGLAALARWGIAVAPLGAMAVGIVFGAELDLVSYLTARYFGMRAYGRCYGIFYACVLVGSAISPMAYGVVADRTGNYDGALRTASVLLLASAFLHWLMPRFPAQAHKPAQ